MNRLLLVFIVPFCSVFMAVGLYCAIRAGRSILKARAIDNWPTVSGEIVKSELVTHAGDEGNTYEVKVAYRYEVDGDSYEGTKVNPAYGASSVSGHQGLYKKLRQAKAVRVAYNPHDPGDAYIVRGLVSADFMPFSMGLTFFFAGLTFLLCGWFATGPSNYDDGVEILEYTAEQQVVEPMG